MAGKTIKIHSRDGGEFDCYLATPAGDGKVPAIVLASAVHGVDVALLRMHHHLGDAIVHERGKEIDHAHAAIGRESAKHVVTHVAGVICDRASR